jgi:uncharacterized protein YybS (DUF2232 family)
MILIVTYSFFDGNGIRFFDILGKTLLIISALPLFIIGAGTIRIFCKHQNINKFFVIAVCIIAFLLVWPITIVIILGFIEPWYKFTEKLK